MAFHRTKENEKKLTADVAKVIKLAKRKTGATAQQISEAIGSKDENFMGYWYRTVLKEARKQGLKRTGAGRGTVWVAH